MLRASPPAPLTPNYHTWQIQHLSTIQVFNLLNMYSNCIPTYLLGLHLSNQPPFEPSQSPYHMHSLTQQDIYSLIAEAKSFNDRERLIPETLQLVPWNIYLSASAHRIRYPVHTRTSRSFTSCSSTDPLRLSFYIPPTDCQRHRPLLEHDVKDLEVRV